MDLLRRVSGLNVLCVFAGERPDGAGGGAGREDPRPGGFSGGAP